jgi:hypothetical protein
MDRPIAIVCNRGAEIAFVGFPALSVFRRQFSGRVKLPALVALASAWRKFDGVEKSTRQILDGVGFLASENRRCRKIDICQKRAIYEGISA